MRLKLVKLATVPLAAAGLVLATASAAPAATGPRHYSGEQAGYVAYKAHFRYIKETFTLPHAPRYGTNVLAFSITVQLRSEHFVAVLGVFNLTENVPWHGYVDVFSQSSRRSIYSNHNSPAMAAGDVVTEEIYFNRFTGVLHFHLADNTSGASFTDTYHAIPGEGYLQARAGAEFGRTPWRTGVIYVPPRAEKHLVTLSGARLTSYSGHRAGWSSWWTHAKVIMTSNGRRTGVIEVRPHKLWNSGHNFGGWLQP